MPSNQLKLELCSFEDINIVQQGAVVYGNQRNVLIQRCYFQKIVTNQGGSCIDLANSSLVVESSCFFGCKNCNSENEAFANILILKGEVLNLTLVSSCKCADSLDSGDSSFFTESIYFNMIDTNASSNYSPDGASSIRANEKSNQKTAFIKRVIDINSNGYTSLEIRYNAEVSYSSIINTKNDKFVVELLSAKLSWSIFVEQCEMFCHNDYSIISVLNCYSDKPRKELTSTTSIFDIPFIRFDNNICKERIEENRIKCMSPKHCCSRLIYLTVELLPFSIH